MPLPRQGPPQYLSDRKWLAYYGVEVLSATEAKALTEADGPEPTPTPVIDDETARRVEAFLDSHAA